MQASSTPAKPKRNSLWPDVSTPDGAAWAVRQAYFAAIIVAALTAVFALLALSGMAWARALGANGWALIDAGIFAVVAIGLSKHSRAAAWCGLVLYVIEKLMMLTTTSAVGGLFISVIFTLAFIGGVRGTTAMHRFRSETPTPQRMAA